MDERIRELSDRLRGTLEEMGSVAVAFSGGVDSTLLAKVAHDTLGDRMVAVTLSLVAVPRRDLTRAAAWCEQEGIEHVVLSFDELTIPGYADNPPDRCYLCKRQVFRGIVDLARTRGMGWVADGSNVDDEGDWRPGMRALEELGVRSPLRECGLTKADVRALSRELVLPTWNLPSAACLSSRFAYGETITREKLERVDRAEEFLHDQGLTQVRVRVHGTDGRLARIEVEDREIERMAAPGVRDHVVNSLRDLGFTYVCLDLAGFRSGAMNEVL